LDVSKSFGSRNSAAVNNINGLKKKAPEYEDMKE
jgi:hypothetical protein